MKTRSVKKRGRARLECELELATKDNFVALCKRTNLTITDLVKKSVALFDVSEAHRRAGGEIIFRHKDGREEKLVLL